MLMERRKLKAVTSLAHSSDLTELFEEISYQRAKRSESATASDDAKTSQGEER
jgi:hypothetical protein